MALAVRNSSATLGAACGAVCVRCCEAGGGGGGGGVGCAASALLLLLATASLFTRQRLASKRVTVTCEMQSQAAHI
jgi:hypothetical protein